MSLENISREEGIEILMSLRASDSPCDSELEQDEYLDTELRRIRLKKNVHLFNYEVFEDDVSFIRHKKSGLYYWSIDENILIEPHDFEELKLGVSVFIPKEHVLLVHLAEEMIGNCMHVSVVTNVIGSGYHPELKVKIVNKSDRSTYRVYPGTHVFEFLLIKQSEAGRPEQNEGSDNEYV